MTMTFSCVMNFVKYPMDTQRCEIDFASYAYTTSDIIYVWKEKPLTIYHGAKNTLPNFLIRSFTNGTCSSITSTGEYSCLQIVLRLQRDFSFFLLQVYLPSTTLIAVAWISYWIDWQATAARFPLVLFTLLTMITQSHVISANLPPVSYTKAIDVWSGTCVIFVFTSLIEYSFVNYSAIRDMKPRSYSQKQLFKNRIFRNLWNWLIALGPRKNRYLVEQQTQIGDSAVQSFAKGGSQRRRRGRVRQNSDTLSYDCRVDTVVAIDFQDQSDHNQESFCSRARIRLGRRNVDITKLCRALKTKSRAERIDFMFRVLYPVAFGMFNLIYWALYW